MGERDEDIETLFSVLFLSLPLPDVQPCWRLEGEKIECGKLLPVNASVPESCCYNFAEFEEALEQLGAE